VEDAQLDFLERCYRRGLYFSDAERAAMFGRMPASTDSHNRALVADVDKRSHRQAPLERLAFLSTRLALPDDMLTKVDRMTMAHSLEARSPFLDHRFVEWAAGVPTRLKLRRGQTKYLLKRVAERYVPRAVLYRPKQGFEIPLAAWFRGDFFGSVRSTLLEPGSACRQTFALEPLKTVLSPHAVTRGGPTAAEKLWILLSFEYWYRMYIDNTYGRV
jgi:asparagine synthase (glutamine-hydrolysing)